jgi:hypothetical protein
MVFAAVHGGGGLDSLSGKLGLGGVPLGNEFEFVSDKDAYETLEAAWDAGLLLLRCGAVVRAWACGTALRQLPPQ